MADIITNAIQFIFDEYKKNKNINMNLIKSLTLDIVYPHRCISRVMIKTDNIIIAIDNNNILLIEYMLNCDVHHYFNYIHVKTILDKLCSDKVLFSGHDYYLIIKLIIDRADKNIGYTTDYGFPYESMLDVLTYACEYDNIYIVKYILEHKLIKDRITLNKLQDLIKVSVDNNDIKVYIDSIINKTYTKLFNMNFFEYNNNAYIIYMNDEYYTMNNADNLLDLNDDFPNEYKYLMYPIVGNYLLIESDSLRNDMKVINTFGNYNIIDFIPNDLNDYYKFKNDINKMHYITEDQFIPGYPKMVRFISLKNVTISQLKMLNIKWT